MSPRPTTYTYRPGISSGALTVPELAAGETVVLEPSSVRREIVISSAGVAFLNGLAPGSEGQPLRIRNGGAYAIALGHEEGAAYGGAEEEACFHCPDAIPFVLRPGAFVDTVYTDARYHVLGVNTFAPGGRLCPPTIAEFLERTAVTVSRLRPCDDLGLGSAQPLREAGNSNLTVRNVPLLDYRLGGYRGVQVTEGGNGWRADVDSPGTGSVLRGAFFGCGADAADNWIAGRFGATNGARTACVVKANGKFAHFCFDGTDLANAEVDKVVTDSVVRLGQVQLDKGANISRARVSGRGEAAVASLDVDASLIGDLIGTGTKYTFVGASETGGGATAVTFVGGVYEIYGVTGAGAILQAKISHRLGME